VDKQLKFIIVTGGVYSGLGKGIVASSISALLSQTHKVVNVKWDGYLNHNPGTMNPREHGEVFVLDDGTEVDLDFGHYERFTGVHATGRQSITAGKLYELIGQLEREGKRFEGQTIQMYHARNLLLEQLISVGKKQQADIVTFEVGGTVGDAEADLALETVKKLQKKLGEKNVFCVHVAPMCYNVDNWEDKTRPLQRSLKELSQHFEPDMLIVRTMRDKPLQTAERRKICDNSALDAKAIFDGKSLDTVYGLPLELWRQEAHTFISGALGIEVQGTSKEWRRRVKNIRKPTSSIDIALCGKYTEKEDSYVSVREALVHAGALLGVGVRMTLLPTEPEKRERDAEEPLEEYLERERERMEEFLSRFPAQLSPYHGIIIPGGYGGRGIDGKIAAIQHAREDRVPFLGLCYGMQLAVVEYARNRCGIADAHTAEVDPATPHPIVTLLPEQEGITIRSGTQRLGAQEARLAEGSLVARLYNATTAVERHRHRYEINPAYHDLLRDKGLVISGVHAQRNDIAEFIELSQDVHPYFVATQAHPELKSTLLAPAPLFVGLVQAAIERRDRMAKAHASLDAPLSPEPGLPVGPTGYAG
jgi:CTP synthase